MHLPYDILKQAHSFRTQLLGETNVEEASGSSWNSLIVKKECEVCKASLVRDLEVHHIRQRAEAKDKEFEDGTKMNDLRNLIVVCQTRHDKHHSGELAIGPEKQTSKGPQREIKQVSSSEKKTKLQKWSDEEKQVIEEYLVKYQRLPLARIVYDLKQQENIEISEGSLRKFRQSQGQQQ